MLINIAMRVTYNYIHSDLICEIQIYVLQSKGPPVGVGGICSESNSKKMKNASKIVMT